MDFKIETKKIKDLTPHPRNEEFFDHLNGDVWESLLESIQKNGLKEPIIVTTDNLIVSGHERVRAYKFLEIEEIICIVREYKNDDEILLDLIEINIIQRGGGNPNLIKMGRCIKERERIYGIHKGNHKETKDYPLKSAKTQKDLINDLGLDRNTYMRYKVIADLPKEYQELIENGTISASTGARFIATLSEEEQIKLLDQLPTTKKYTQKQVQNIFDEMQLQLQQKEDRIMILEEEKKELQNSDAAYMEKQKELEKAQAELRRVYERAERQVGIINRIKKDVDNNSIAAELVKSNYKLLESLASTLSKYLRNVGGVAKYMKTEDKERYRNILNKIEDDTVIAIENIRGFKLTGNSRAEIKRTI